MVEHYPGTTPVESGSSTRGSEVAGQAKQQGQQIAQQARQQAGDLANRGTEQLKSQLANQKHEASQRMVPVQSALRETGQQLRKQGQGSVAGYADKAADQVERFSGYLRETEVDEIMDEARGFARRRPAVFLGGAVALGFLATRFLKSSSQEQASSGGYGTVPTATGTATSSATVTHGTGEHPGMALPPRAVEGELPAEGRSPTVRRTPMTGPFPSEERPAEPPRGF
jgi:hypothetical protein